MPVEQKKLRGKNCSYRDSRARLMKKLILLGEEIRESCLTHHPNQKTFIGSYPFQEIILEVYT